MFLLSMMGVCLILLKFMLCYVMLIKLLSPSFADIRPNCIMVFANVMAQYYFLPFL